MRFATSAFRKEDGLIMLAAAATATLYVAAGGGGFPLDDSWIHQTYGRNLAERGEWAFIPGVPSAASTSPLYTLLLAVGYKLGIHYALWAHLLGVLALALAGMLAMRMAERLIPQIKHAGLLTGLAVVLAWHLIWAAASGMETMLFSMLTLVLIYVSWRELNGRSTQLRRAVLRGVVFGVLAALTTLARPEGVVLAGLIGLAMLISQPQGSWRAVIAWGTGAALGFVVVISPYLLLNLQLTGGLLPTTAAAKEAEVRPLLSLSFPRRLMLLIAPLSAGGQFGLVPGVVYFCFWMLPRYATRREKPLYLLPLIWVIALIALYAARLPAAHQHGRYVIPVLPSFIVVGIIGTAGLAQSISSSGLVSRVAKRTYLISAAGLFLFFALVTGPSIYRTDVRVIEEEMVDPAHWILGNLPEDELLAVHDIGAVGYFSRRPMLLDLAGLINPEVVPVLFEKEALYELMRERNTRFLMAFPYQTPGEDSGDSRLCPLYSSGGLTSSSIGGDKMVIYRLAWDGVCPPTSG